MRIIVNILLWVTWESGLPLWHKVFYWFPDLSWGATKVSPHFFCHSEFLSLSPWLKARLARSIHPENIKLNGICWNTVEFKLKYDRKMRQSLKKMSDSQSNTWNMHSHLCDHQPVLLFNTKKGVHLNKIWVLSVMRDEHIEHILMIFLRKYCEQQLFRRG